MTSREDIADALVRLVADEGLPGVSVRRVAACAGVSAGLVQHHYPTKQLLVVAAMERVSALVRSRLGAAPAGGPADRRLRALVRQVLPLDEERAVEARVWLAFVAAAATDPALAAVHAEGWRQVEDAIARLLADHRGPDRHGSSAAVRDDAGLLLAALDGLAVAAVVEPGRMPPGRVEHLAGLLVDDVLRDGRRLVRPGS